MQPAAVFPIAEIHESLSADLASERGQEEQDVPSDRVTASCLACIV